MQRKRDEEPSRSISTLRYSRMELRHPCHNGYHFMKGRQSRETRPFSHQKVSTKIKMSFLSFDERVCSLLFCFFENFVTILYTRNSDKVNKNSFFGTFHTDNHRILFPNPARLQSSRISRPIITLFHTTFLFARK